jgi:hypothetical protein
MNGDGKTVLSECFPRRNSICCRLLDEFVAWKTHCRK